MATTTAETVVTTVPATPPAAHTPKEANRRKQGRMAAWFLAPTVIGVGLFTVVPMIASIVLAFFSWDIISTPKFIGLKNFATIATSSTIRVSFLNTFGFVIVAVILQIVVALGLAVLVQTKMPGWLRGFFRSAFFFPLILSAASVSLIMSYLFNEDFGTINKILALIGLGPVKWLSTAGGAMVVTIIVYVWQNFGFTFLLFIGGLSSIPADVYEASSIDGASGWNQFSRITLPLVSPTMLVASVMAIISALQIFDQPYVLTRGGPGDSTRTAVMVIYQSAFTELHFGLAAAIGLVLMLVIMLATWAQFKLSTKFVFYM